MHGRKVAWLDGKPDNILCCDDPVTGHLQITVCDFDASMWMRRGMQIQSASHALLLSGSGFVRYNKVNLLLVLAHLVVSCLMSSDVKACDAATQQIPTASTCTPSVDNDRQSYTHLLYCA